jgi:hypothetical protein
VTVQIETAGEEAVEVALSNTAVDPFFKVRCIEETEVTSAEDLERLQKQLTAIDPYKAFNTAGAARGSAGVMPPALGIDPFANLPVAFHSA